MSQMSIVLTPLNFPIGEWGLEGEEVGIDPKELREKFDPRRWGEKKGCLFPSGWRKHKPS